MLVDRFHCIHARFREYEPLTRDQEFKKIIAAKKIALSPRQRRALDKLRKMFKGDYTDEVVTFMRSLGVEEVIPPEVVVAEIGTQVFEAEPPFDEDGNERSFIATSQHMLGWYMIKRTRQQRFDRGEHNRMAREFITWALGNGMEIRGESANKFRANGKPLATTILDGLFVRFLLEMEYEIWNDKGRPTQVDVALERELHAAICRQYPWIAEVEGATPKPAASVAALAIEHDLFPGFLADRCEFGAECSVTKDDMVASCGAWYAQQGARAPTKEKLTNRLKAMGVTTHKPRIDGEQVPSYKGVRLR